MSLDAFTIVRNGIKLGYPFVESVVAVLPFVERFYIEEGHSDDDTFFVLSQLAHKYPQVQLSRHRWKQMQTGFAIGEATNSLLERINVNATAAAWLLYVQADELWHPNSLRYLTGVLERFSSVSAPYDAIDVAFLHIAENYQKLQFAPGQESYRRAIRVIRNTPSITSHRDAWTFEGCSRVFHADPTVCEVVHANSTGLVNWAAKAAAHAQDLYPDLGHYAATAAERRAALERAVATNQVEPHWLAQTSPFQDRLPVEVWPLFGQLQYEPNAELLK